MTNLTVVNQTQEVPKASKIYRFDIFKGIADKDGKVRKIKSVGHALLYEGSTTYNIFLKTLLTQPFFILPERKKTEGGPEYVILTREPSKRAGRKYYWHNVGEGAVLKTPNAGLVQLSWDILGFGDVYMDMYPFEVPARSSDADQSVDEVIDKAS